MRTGKDVLGEFTAADVEESVLLSTAYIFSLPELKAEKLDVAGLVRAENRFTVDQAQIAPKRLPPIVSVPVLEPSAKADELLAQAHRGAGREASSDDCWRFIQK